MPISEFAYIIICIISSYQVNLHFETRKKISYSPYGRDSISDFNRYLLFLLLKVAFVQISTDPQPVVPAAPGERQALEEHGRAERRQEPQRPRRQRRRGGDQGRPVQEVQPLDELASEQQEGLGGAGGGGGAGAGPAAAAQALLLQEQEGLRANAASEGAGSQGREFKNTAKYQKIHILVTWNVLLHTRVSLRHTRNFFY